MAEQVNKAQEEAGKKDNNTVQSSLNKTCVRRNISGMESNID